MLVGRGFAYLTWDKERIFLFFIFNCASHDSQNHNFGQYGVQQMGSTIPTHRAATACDPWIQSACAWKGVRATNGAIIGVRHGTTGELRAFLGLFPW